MITKISAKKLALLLIGLTVPSITMSATTDNASYRTRKTPAPELFSSHKSVIFLTI
jgi:hypothetical protein